MTQPLPSESIEYERYVDGLRRSNAAMLMALKGLMRGVTASHEINDWLSGIAGDQARAAIADAEGTSAIPSKTITIHIEGGMVADVLGIPPGVELHVHDHDEGDRSHPSWDEEKRCFVAVYGGDGV